MPTANTKLNIKIIDHKDQRIATLEAQLRQVEKCLMEFEKFILGKSIKLPFGKRLFTDLLAYKALKRAIAGGQDNG